MTKSKILATAAALMLTGAAVLPNAASAKSFSLGDFLGGGQAGSESVEVASANSRDDRGNETETSESGRDHDGGHDGGESSDHGDAGGDGDGGSSGGDGDGDSGGDGDD